MNRSTRLFVAALAFCFLLKLIAGWYLRDGFLTRGNSHTFFCAIASNLNNYGQFSIERGTPSVDYEPAYSVMIAVAFKLFGSNWLGILLFQALLHGATSLLLLLVCVRLGNRNAGIIAGSMHAIYPFLFLHTLSIIDSTLFVFLVVLSIWSILGCWTSGRTWEFVWLGIASGLALLTRGSFIAFGPAFALMFVCAVWKHRNIGAFKKATLCVGIAAILVGPWVARNYRMTGIPLISTHGPFGVWQGNNVHTLEFLKNDISLDEIYRLDPPPKIYQQYPLKPRVPQKAVEAANVYKEEALRFIYSHPFDFAELAMWKFIKFWTPFYNPVAKRYDFGGADLRKLVYTASYLPVLLLAIPGAFVLSRQHKAGAWLLIGLIAFYTVAHMIAMSYSRLRLPLDPILMVFAAHLLVAKFTFIRMDGEPKEVAG